MSSIKSMFEVSKEDIETFSGCGLESATNSLDSRQRMLLGENNITKRRNKYIVLVGNGTGNNPVAINLAEKGYNLIAVDGDNVDESNLSHQCFGEEDLDKNKAVQIAKKSCNAATKPIETVGIPMFFEQAAATDTKWLERADAVVVFTDNMPSRFEVANHFLGDVPVLAAGIDKTNTMAWLFIQEPGQACLRCCFPNLKLDSNKSTSCTGMSLDPARAISGYISFSIDTLFLDHKYRRRNWNYLNISLDGFVSENREFIKKNKACEFCSRRAKVS